MNNSNGEARVATTIAVAIVLEVGTPADEMEDEGEKDQ